MGVLALSGVKALMVLTVLIVDDEPSLRTLLVALVESFGHTAAAVSSGEEALAVMHERVVDLVLLDLKLGKTSGLDVLPHLLEYDPNVEIVLMTAYSSVSTAVAAMKLGARDYLPKPFEPERIELMLRARAEAKRLRLAVLEHKLQSPDLRMESESPLTQKVLDTALRAARSEAAILLRGESGTGKSVLARWIHGVSMRAAGPFATVNCPTLSDELLASQLFGHVRGAFTGALKDAPGRVEAAHGGTLFLDEVADLSAGNQARLLRFAQDRSFERLGDTHTRRADVRLISATNRSLNGAHFREDLLFRLNVLTITLPPLRERREDIPLLAERYLRETGRPGQRFAADAIAVLQAGAWPGNLRELRNTVERAAILTDGDVVRIDTPHTAGVRLGDDLPLEHVERAHVLSVLGRHGPEDAARILEIDPATLWRKRKRWAES